MLPFAFMMDPKTQLVGGRPSTQARASLVIRHEGGTQLVDLVRGVEVVVGRTAEADVCVEHATLSRRHARLRWNGAGGVWVEDLESTNGVFVGQERVNEALLLAGDECRLGDVVVTAQISGVGDAQPIDGYERFEGYVRDELRQGEKQHTPFSLLRVEGSAEDLGALLEMVRALSRPGDRVALVAGKTILWGASHCDAKGARARLAHLIAASPHPLRLGAVSTEDSSHDEEALLLNVMRSELLVGSEPNVQTLRSPRDDAPRVLETPSLRSVFRQADRLASSNLSILILGETGSGKELVARAIHDAGPRSARSFVAVNCGAIPEALLASTLFGHVRGSFTDASRDSKGLFREADEGTLFLDEVGELSRSAQTALLRVLEEGAVLPVGATKHVQVNVRVLAATHRSLERMIASGAFREDLFYRLAGAIIEVPPLRARPAEVLPLAEHFLSMSRRDGATVALTLEADTVSLLERYPWPGNVRELRSVIDRAVALTAGVRITPEELPARVRAEAPPKLTADLDDDGDELPFKQRVHRFEESLIRAALAASNGNKTEAARRLEMPIRTLSYKVKAFGIEDTP